MKVRMRDGTGTAALRYLVEDVDRHGNVRVYVRRGPGPKIRIRATPGTDAFLAEYRAALEGAAGSAGGGRGAAPGSLRGLCEAYYRSAEFKALGDSTRRVRRAILEKICETKGDKPFALMEPRHVRALRDAKAELPEAANARVKALRQLFAWAIEAEHAERNPARDVPYLRGGGDGFHTWTVAEVRQFEARWPLGTRERLALALLLYTGCRRSDVVRLGRQMERDGWLCFAEAKGAGRKRKERELPILPQLRAAIDAVTPLNLTYLTTTFGKPFTAAGFGNWFRDRCDRAGLPHCSAHGLRKAGATIAAENGATEHELMAIFGWESPKMAALYTRKADRKRLTGRAMRLLVPIGEEQKMDATVPPAPSGGTKTAKSR